MLEWIHQNLPFILAGISVGGQYALIAIGYTMVYGILRLINFAHGDIFMVAGIVMVYATTELTRIFPANPVASLSIALLVVIGLTVLIGFCTEKIAYKPLRNAPRMSVMISAIGVSYLLQNLVYYITGGLNQNYPQIPWLSDTVKILDKEVFMTTIPSLAMQNNRCMTRVMNNEIISSIHPKNLAVKEILYEFGDKRVLLITPILTIVLVVALVCLIRYTKIGMAMRAASKDFETSQLMGIRINKVISTTFIIGSLLAAVGSILYYTKYTGVTPTSGSMPGLKAFVAAVFGGIGSIPGAVVGAFIIGICENIIKGLGWTTFSDAFTFALLIVILVVKPTGLFGEKATDKV